MKKVCTGCCCHLTEQLLSLCLLTPSCCSLVTHTQSVSNLDPRIQTRFQFLTTDSVLGLGFLKEIVTVKHFFRLKCMRHVSCRTLRFVRSWRMATSSSNFIGVCGRQSSADSLTQDVRFSGMSFM